MKRRTLCFLLAGCALVLWLETPHTLAALATLDELPRVRPAESARRAPPRAGLDATIELARGPVSRAG